MTAIPTNTPIIAAIPAREINIFAVSISESNATETAKDNNNPDTEINKPMPSFADRPSFVTNPTATSILPSIRITSTNPPTADHSFP